MYQNNTGRNTDRDDDRDNGNGAIRNWIKGRVTRANEHGFQIDGSNWLNPSKFASPNMRLPGAGEFVSVGLDARGFVRLVTQIQPGDGNRSQTYTRNTAIPSGGDRSWERTEREDTRLWRSQRNEAAPHALPSDVYVPFDSKEEGEDDEEVGASPTYEGRVKLIAAAASVCSQIETLSADDVVPLAAQWESWCLGDDRS